MKSAKTIVVLLLYSLLAQQANAQLLQDDSAYLAYYKHVITRLSDTSMYGRPCCSTAEKLSADFIAAEMKKHSGKKVFRQRFKVFPKDSTQACTSQNVYCYINNKSKKTILIGAHYDHIGYGGTLSKSIGKKQIHPGADDNASGVALTLALLKSKLWKRNKAYNYLFAAYSAHEVGLYGSTEFSKMCSTGYGTLHLVINFDMVGRMDATTKMLVVHGGQDFLNLEKLFPEKDSLINTRLDDSTRLFMLDTKAFKEIGVPCLSFTTGLHNDYHKTSDNEPAINYKGIWLIHQKLLELLAKPEQIQFKRAIEQ